MPLPRVKSPTYPLTLPASKQQIVVRQLLSGEYKKLLSVISMGDDDATVTTFGSVLSDCVESQGFDFDSLSFVDVEYLFLKLYSLSADSMIRISMACSNELEDGTCNTQFGMVIPIEEVLPSSTEHDRTIDLGDGVGVKLKYPSWSSWYKTPDKDKTDGDVLFQVIESVWDNDSVYTPGVDFTREEIEEFYDNLTVEATEKILQFIEDMPTVEWKTKVTCPNPKCKHEESFILRGLDDFLE